MAYKDLQKFIEILDKENELIRINEEVDSDLEITEIADRVMKSSDNNKALLFTNIKGSPYPLLINAFGSLKRMSMSLQVDNLESISNDILSFMDLSQYKTLTNKVFALPKLSRLAFSFPIKVRRGACQQVVEEPKLSTLPVLKCWPEDGGKFFTLPLVVTKDPETGQQNMGMYRMQVYDDKTTGMHWHWHKDGREIYDKYRKLGHDKMPVSVVVGADPATVYAATAPLPKMIDEMMFASFLRKRPLPIVKCKTNDIYVPANAEFVLEGYVKIDELRLEGPFGDHTGYYSLADMYPVFHVEKITRKKKPVFHATIVGIPPMEDCFLALATEEIFLPLIQMMVPEIQDLHMPFEGVFHNCALASIEKSYPKQAHKVMNSFWGTGQMMYQKFIGVFDKDVNIKDYKTIFWNGIKNVNFGSDVLITEGPLDALDHSSKKPFFGSRLGIDLTTKLNEEIDHTINDEQGILNTTNLDEKEILKILKGSFPQITDLHFPSDSDFNYIALISVDKKEAFEIHELSRKIRTIEPMNRIKLIVFLTHTVDIRKYNEVFWRTFNNIDAKRDLLLTNYQDITLADLDATRKLPPENGNRNWPNDIIMSPEIIDKVTKGWSKYEID